LSGQLLSTDGNGVMSWITGIGTGDVVGPVGSVTDGNFAVFDTSGQIIKESVAASLSATGAAVFNSSVTLGVGGTTTGQLVFRNSSNAFTTTIQASTSASASAIYTWPQAQAASAGLLLANDGAGNLSWTATGAGNMILASTQTNTGAKTFNSGTLILAGSTSGTTVLNSGAAAGSSVLTLPIAVSTLAALGVVQNWSQAQTFQAGVALSTGGTFTTAAAVASTFSGSVTMNAAGSTTVAQLTFSGTTNNWISFGQTGANNPTTPTVGALRSTGTKVVLFGNPPATYLDAALGVSGEATGGVLWLSSANSIKFFASNVASVEALNIQYTATVRGIHLSAASIATNTIPQLLVGPTGFSAGGQYIGWPTSGQSSSGAPLLGSTRSAGSKLVFGSNITTSLLDVAIGYGGEVTGGSLWLSSAGAIRFYTGDSTTVKAAFDGTASESRLTLTNATAVSIIAATATTANVFNTVATTINIGASASSINIGPTFGGTFTVNSNTVVGSQATIVLWNTTSTNVSFAGAATTLAIGNTATTAQTVNMFTASTGASTYNFATGATAASTTKTINIGTAGVSGSTTAINIGSAVSGATNTVAIRGNLTLGASGGNMGFYGTAAIAKPTNAIAEAAFVANAGGVTVTDDSTFGTYTIRQVVQALQNLGLLT
jgi:hypothetical protein